MSLTSANCTILLAVSGLFPQAQQLQGFGADDVIETDDVEPAETRLGVDGILSGGWVPTAPMQRFTLQGDSASIVFFETLYQTQRAQKEIFRITGTLILPAVGRAYTLSRGIMSGYKPISDGKKILSERKFGIRWEKVTPIPIPSTGG